MPPGERVLPAAEVIGVSFPADPLAEVAGVDRADALGGLAAHARTGLVCVAPVPPWRTMPAPISSRTPGLELGHGSEQL